MAASKKILTCRNSHWSKKIRGKIHYFGKDYDTAVAKYLNQKPYLEAGLSIPDSLTGPTVRDLLNDFLSDRQERIDEGTFSRRTYEGYQEVTDFIAKAIDVNRMLLTLRAEDFIDLRKALANGVRKKASQKTLDRRLGYARTIFRFAMTDSRLIDRNLPYVKALACVPKMNLRREKANAPDRSLTANEIRKLVEHASTKFKAIILLGINGGFNNSDIAHFPLEIIHPTVPKVLIYPRRKTYFMRQTPLWPETVAALNEVRREREHVETDLPNFFINSNKKSYVPRDRYCLIADTFKRYLKRLDLYRPGKNFGALRSTFAQIGTELNDDVAVKAVMGHGDGSFLYENYSKRVFIPRLTRVTDHVRKWLYETDSD